MSTDELMQTITDKYEHCNIGKGLKKKETAAFSANKGRGKKGESKQKSSNCNNCRKPGHWARDCWKDSGSKAGQGPQKKKKKKKSDSKSESGKKKKGKEAAASAKAKKEEDSTWFVMTTLTKFEDN